MSISPGVDQEKVVAFIADNWQKWKGNRIQMEQVWRDCFFRAFSRWPDGAMINKGSNENQIYYHPAVENMVETVTAKLIHGVMPSDTFFEIMPSNDTAVSKADAATAILKYVHKKNRIKKELKKMVQQAVITGNSPWHLNWCQRMTSVPDQKLLGEREAAIKASQLAGIPSNKLIIPTQPLLTYAGPDFFVSSIFDFVIDPWPENEDNAMRMRRVLKHPSFVAKMGQENEFGYSVYEWIQGIYGDIQATYGATIHLTAPISGRPQFDVSSCFLELTFKDESNASATMSSLG